MQALDLPCNSSLDHRGPDPSAMSEHYSPIHSPNHHSAKNPQNKKSHVENNIEGENTKENNDKNTSANENNGSSSLAARRERPSRACTQRAAARMQAAAEAEAAMAEAERKKKKAKRRQRLAERLLKEESEEEGRWREEEEEVGEEEEGGSSSLSRAQCCRIVTPLLGEPEASQLPRWNIRSMWQLASILDFLNVFRPLLNVKVEFSADEFETALITPNNTLAEIHMPLLKAIRPVTRIALGHATWITVLCRKLKDWWYWVAEGDLPIVASHGTEVEAYNALDPRVRVIILKALCDIRVEQEDIRNHIDDSIKHGIHLSTFRKERLGGDSYGVSYWYEDDPIVGHRLYREIRKVEVKKGKGRNIPPIPHSSYQWEAVATNLEEFQNVSEKLFSSKNRTEVTVGKKLKNDLLPEIEKVHKRKEKLLKKQHRQALMLDNMIHMDGLAAGGRSMRDRKPVTYTFDDYDRSINEALKVTNKKQPSPEASDGREPHVKIEVSMNGGLNSPSQHSLSPTFLPLSPKSLEDDEYYDDQETQTLDRSNRRRQRPERYSVKEFVEAISDNEADYESDDDIVGEVVYDDEYLRKRKRRKMSSSSEGDEEYHWDEENNEEEEEDDDMLSSEDSKRPRRFKQLLGRTRRGTKLRSVDALQSGPRRSKRATRTRINYRQYEFSESDTESMKPEKSNMSDDRSYSSDDEEFSMNSQDSDERTNKQEVHTDQPIERRHREMGSRRATRTRIDYRQYEMTESDTESMKHEEAIALDEHSYSSDDPEYSRGSRDSDGKIDKQEEINADQPTEERNPEMVGEKQTGPPEETNQEEEEEEAGGVRNRRFLDLNELAPGSGFDDGPSSMRDEDRDGL